MFICQLCYKNISGSPIRIITKKRDKTYSNEKIKYVKGEKVTQTKTSEGWEIVQEKEICGGCNAKNT